MLWKSLLLFLMVLLTVAIAALPASSDPAPVRHLLPGSAPAVPADAFSFDPGTGSPMPLLMPGRRSGEKAARLDQGALVAVPFPIARAFTVEMWCRSFGPGARRGNSGATNGMLIAVGDGYWSGWRLTVTYPEAVVGFEIGRPQPSSSVGLSGGALATGAWQHVAASWDGRTMRLYVNGLLVASGPYDGLYTPPTGGQMRIGFADAGVGSLKLDVAEMTVYDQALDPLAILEAACDTPLPERFHPAFRQTLDAEGRGETSDAAAGFRALTAQAGLPPAYRAATRMAVARFLADPEPASAAREYAALLEGTDVPEVFRQSAAAALLNLVSRGAAGNLPPRSFESLLKMSGVTTAQRIAALFGNAQVLRQAHEYPQARAQYDQLLKLPQLPLRDRWEAGLERVHVLAESGALRDAYAAARTLAHAPGAPGYYGSLALLAVARSAARAHQYPLAREIYREVMTLPDAPAHHVEEGRAGLRVVDRLAGGLPAEDPALSRLHLPPALRPALRLYVAPSGRDTNPGTWDQPFATLARARDAVRSLRPFPPGGITILLSGGEYRLAESLALTAEDSGTAQAPIVYAAAEGETPVLTGAATLGGFVPVTDPDVLARLPQEARGHVLQTDLRAAGVTDFGKLQPHGFGQAAVPLSELFFNGRPMTLARWPNTGFLLTGKVMAAGAEGQVAHGIAFEYTGTGRPAGRMTKMSGCTAIGTGTGRTEI